jgi:uncharacterized protein YlzI (FlbEa/FlbD family)
MICVHRLRGDEFWLNPDLVVFVEGGPHQTAITLADGNRVTVHETPEEVAATVMRFRASVLVVADELAAVRSHRAAAGAPVTAVAVAEPELAIAEPADADTDGAPSCSS